MTRSFEEESRVLQNIILQGKQRIASKPIKTQETEQKEAIWQYEPVSPSEFILSPHFLNDKEGRIWPCIIDDMEAIFRKPDKNGKSCFFPVCNVYYNISGIGSGKSTVVSIFNAYVVHLLLCLRDPCSYFGLFDTSILLMDVAPTEEKARDIVFAKTHNIVHRCAWFHETNNLPEARLKSKLKFYKHINTTGMTESQLHELEMLEQKGQAEIMPTVVVAPGSSKISAPVGADLYMGVIDEACSDNGFETNNKDTAGDIFDSMNERRASRFLDDGLVCAISSAGNEDRWLEKKMIELEIFAHKNNRSANDVIDYAGLKYMIRRRPSYVANPKYSFYFNQGKTFTYTAERISEDGTKLQTHLEIPDVFMQKFQNDPYGSLKNICALPTASVFRWITDWNGIVSRVNKNRNDPFPDPQDADQPVLPSDVMAGLPPSWMGEDGVHYFCLPAGTKVMMGDLSKKNIEDIKKGDSVLSGAGKCQRVEATSKKHRSGKMIELDIRGQNRLICTSDHRILVLRRQKITPSQKQYKHSILYPDTWLSAKFASDYMYCPEWIESENVKVGDYVCRPRVRSSRSNSVGGRTIDACLSEILGWYIAEGCEGTAGNIQITLHENEHKIANYLLNKWKHMYSGGGGIYHHPNEKSITLHLWGNKELCEWIFNVCGSAKRGGKKIDKDMLYNTSDDVLREFMIAWYGGDGYWNRTQLYICTSYDCLAEFAKLAFARLGFVSTCITVINKTGFKNALPSHRVTISGSRQIEMFLYGRSARPRDKLHGFVTSDFEFAQVTSKIERESSEVVYDLQIANDHSFVASGFIVHNCHVDFGTGGTSSSGKDSCGLCIGSRGPDTIRGDGENQIKLPTVHIDLSIRFKTHGRTEATETGLRESERDLKLSAVRDFIIWCHHKRNFRFAKITFDNFQSLDSIQILRERGYLVEKEGVTNESYDTMRTLWYDDRLDIFWDEHALKELRKLERKANGKIEKSVGSSDDEIECIAKVCELAIQNEVPEVKRKRAFGFAAQGSFAGGQHMPLNRGITPATLVTPVMRPSAMRPRLPHIKR